MKKKLTWIERQRYKLDEQMSKGSLGLIKLLTTATVVVLLLIAVILHLAGLIAGEENSFAAEAWNTLATIINKWLPFYGDGWRGYRIMMTVASIFGLFVTSVLIGIISSAIDEKIASLKKGNLSVLEEGHIVVLGFKPGEYTLLQELVYGADKRKRCIVVGSELSREEMEDCIEENVECPKNVRILCRTVNIFDPVTLERCALESCQTVLISPTDNDRTVRTLLAVTKILHDVPDSKIRTIAVLSQNDYRIPQAVIEKYGILLLHTEGTIARIMAHSCTQPGLSQAMLEMFHFAGSEFHIVSLPGMEGLSFEELLCRVDCAFPIGICKGDEIYLNPDAAMRLEQGDRLLAFCEESDSAKLLPASALQPIKPLPPYQDAQPAGHLVIIGCNEFLSTILLELSENVTSVTLADVPEDFRDAALQAAARRETKLSVSFFEKDTAELSTLEELAKTADHIVLLSDRNRPDDEADMHSIFNILTLRDIRDRFGLNFNITVEMRLEINQNLVISEAHTEFILSSNMSSRFLAQLSESPELIKVFNELLTNEGNEVYMKTAEELHCEGTWTGLELRRRLLPQHYVMIGYMDGESLQSSFDLSLNDSVTLKPNDKLIVIGEN